MPSLAQLLEGESTTIDLEPGDFERLLRRRDRKRRNERIRAGVLAILVLVVTIFGLARNLNTDDRTATDPTPTPIHLGSLGALAYGVDGDIYVADWDGSDPVRIADGSPGGVEGCGPSGYWAEGPIWSPNGRYLAYRGPVCEAIDTVWISDPQGNVVTSFPSEGWLISWSPDSTRVAVWVRLGKTIGVYGLDGVRQSLLRVPPGLMASGDFDPVWSRDGMSLLVPHGVLVPLDGRDPRQLPPDDPRSLDAKYSPDGSRVAYLEALPTGPSPNWGALVVASADGSGARELVCCLVGDFVWSPSGDQIAFVQQTSETDKGYTVATELRVIDVASGTVTRLAGMGGTDIILLNPQFAPDGDRILFLRADSSYQETSLWTVDADGSDLRRLVQGSDVGDWQTISGR